jgi:hypothetical protein
MKTIYSLKFEIDGKKFPLFFETKAGSEKGLELIKAFLTEEGQRSVILEQSTQHELMSDNDVSKQIRIISQIVLDAEDELERAKRKQNSK